MKIKNNELIKIELTEEEYCAIVYAIRRLLLDKDNVDAAPYTQEALFEVATQIGGEMVDALRSPIP